ncbi:hypothetical protein AAVH_13250 [Aphelenchoides avenae]|nr:hypothetical protein AAVH_13250 [Aphelenchus avenae]
MHLDKVSGLDCKSGESPHSLDKSVYDPNPLLKEYYQLVGYMDVRDGVEPAR